MPAKFQSDNRYAPFSFLIFTRRPTSRLARARLSYRRPLMLHHNPGDRGFEFARHRFDLALPLDVVRAASAVAQACLAGAEIDANRARPIALRHDSGTDPAGL